jgi:hypothetical protein
MRRALWAAAVVVAAAALITPLVATAKKDTSNPDLTIEVDPTIQTWPRQVTVTGRLQGQDRANQTITVQANPHPFSGPYEDVGTTTTDANGDYTLRVKPEEHTNYRAVAKDVTPRETSGEILVKSRMKITRRVDDRTPVDGQTITFSGRVGPAHEGQHVFLQRRRPSGSWKTVTSTPLGPEQADQTSIYSEEIVANRDGRWRAKVKADENHRGNKSHSIRINVQGE